MTEPEARGQFELFRLDQIVPCIEMMRMELQMTQRVGNFYKPITRVEVKIIDDIPRMETICLKHAIDEQVFHTAVVQHGKTVFVDVLVAGMAAVAGLAVHIHRIAAALSLSSCKQ